MRVLEMYPKVNRKIKQIRIIFFDSKMKSKLGFGFSTSKYTILQHLEQLFEEFEKNEQSKMVTATLILTSQRATKQGGSNRQKTNLAAL